ncbi:Uncharacterised protein [Yersinia frederiksenii]|nr:Uncharacterised protein [Yersinia frederiksenii]
MLHTDNPIIKHKAGLLNLAEELGNVSKSWVYHATRFIVIKSWPKKAVTAYPTLTQFPAN